MTDEVKYALPLGWIGFLAHWIFVKRKLNAIFDYRFEVLSRIFNKKEPDQGSLPG
jgi:ligand-binding SRPBCC domain-containing protein